MRQHAADRRARRRRDRVRQRRCCPRSRRPRATTRTRTCASSRSKGAQERYGRVAGARRARAHRLRARRHQVDGVLRLLPRRVGPRALREVTRHPGRARARERGRFVRRVLPAHRRHRPDQVRPAVRAVPQPGPQADARHRHGLRLALPRRDDPVRRRALRRRPRRADHHVLDDQGAGRGARRGAGARLPVRGRRQDRQAHAAARSWAATRRCARASRRSRATPTATRWRPSCARSTTPIPTPSASSTSPAASKGCAARTASTPRPSSSRASRSPSTSRSSASPSPAAPIEDAPIVTQYEMHGVEDLGLLKMDFLGLRNLDVIEITLDLVERSHRARAPTSTTSRSTTRRPSSCCAGATRSACSSSKAARCARCCARSRPTQFEDVAALVALYRPGPMAQNWHNEYADRKNGRKPVAYDHADLEEILAPTYGLMIYQEQLMRVAQQLAGYSLEEADNLRKATGKKIRDADREGAHEVRRGLRRAGPRDASSASRSSTPSSRSPTTRSTSRTPSATASSRTRPRT